jgi:1-acyl-sn-glycerol-3-phosphate acyltransferase
MAVGVRRKVQFLTTTSMFRKPLSALLFRHLGCVPLRRALALVASGGVLGVFAEGRRSWAGETVL